MLFLISCVAIEENTIWSGNLYELQGSQLELSASSSIQMLNTSGEEILSSENPYPDTSYYHELHLSQEELSKNVLLLLNAENSYPTMYVGQTPTTNAIWLNGSLYSYGKTWTDSFFMSLGQEISSPSEGEYAQLIGRPNVPEDWAGAEFTVYHESGETYTIDRYRYDESGFLLAIQDGEEFDRIDLFVCTNLQEGNVAFDVITEDSRVMTVSYYAQKGTVINATHLLFPTEQ